LSILGLPNGIGNNRPAAPAPLPMDGVYDDIVEAAVEMFSTCRQTVKETIK